MFGCVTVFLAFLALGLAESFYPFPPNVAHSFALFGNTVIATGGNNTLALPFVVQFAGNRSEYQAKLAFGGPFGSKTDAVNQVWLKGNSQMLEIYLNFVDDTGDSCLRFPIPTSGLWFPKVLTPWTNNQDARCGRDVSWVTRWSIPITPTSELKAQITLCTQASTWNAAITGLYVDADLSFGISQLISTGSPMEHPFADHPVQSRCSTLAPQ